MGTAMALASVESAFDIVLNAIAIGFIFDIDDMLYHAFLPLYKRLRYQRKGSISTLNPLATCDGAHRVSWRWTWLLLVLDVGMSVAMYYHLVAKVEHEGDDPFHSIYYWMAIFTALRAATFGAAFLYLNSLYLCRRQLALVHLIAPVDGASLPRLARASCLLGDMLRLLVSVGTTIGSGFFAHCLFKQFDFDFGFNSDFVEAPPGSTWYECVHATDRTPACKNPILMNQATTDHFFNMSIAFPQSGLQGEELSAKNAFTIADGMQWWE